MNIRKTIRLLGIIFSIIFIISCSKEESINNELEGSWKVISYEDYQNSSSITKTEENTWNEYNNGDITINFTFSNDQEGNISGKNVTNTFYGEFIIDSGQKISIKNTNWTEINEPEWARLFHSILKADTYEIKSKRLIIYYNEKQNAIVLEKI